MAHNILQLNDSKSEIILFNYPNSHINLIENTLVSLFFSITHTARNPGVLFDSDLSFQPHVKKDVQYCYMHLRTISKIKLILSHLDLEKVIHALIFSHLDFCNLLLSGITQKTLSRLQQVQNPAVRLLTGFNGQHHITPILTSLHWLSVHFRTDFKILLITFKACMGLAQSCITDMLTPYEPTRHLRSSYEALPVVPKLILKSKGDRRLLLGLLGLGTAYPRTLSVQIR